MTEIDLTDEQDQAQGDPFGEQSLYLKYRPHSFDDVLGQQNAVAGIKKRIEDGSIMSSHAYMFTGPRGSGKTTTARILAAALNCEFRTDGNPCGTCDQCVAIMSGRVSGSVNELNSADNRGIDAMRYIVDTMAMGVSTRYKVYIFDEVHLLTRDAASLFLKYLEEPPSDNIVFILATTDPEQVLDTIRSRCTQIHFRDISDQDLLGLVRSISEKESMDLTEKQLNEAVDLGNGSARDTISALESVSLGMGFSVRDTLHSLLDASIRRDVSAGILSIAASDAEGTVNYRTLVSKMFSFWRDAMIYSSNPELLPAKSDDMEDLLERASKLGMVTIGRNLNTLAGTIAQMKREGGHRILLEGALVSMMVPGSKSQWDSIVAEIEDLREDLLREIQDLKRGVPTLPAPSDGASAPKIKSKPKDDTSSEDPWADSHPKDATEDASWPEGDGGVSEGDQDGADSEDAAEDSIPDDAPEMDLEEFQEIWDEAMKGYTTRWANSLRKADVQQSDGGFVILTARPVLEKVQSRVLDDLDLDVNITFEHE